MADRWVRVRLKLEALESRLAPAVIVDNGQQGYREIGTNWNSASGGYGGAYRFTDAGSGNHKATWSVRGLAPGSYSVQVTWLAGAWASDATYTIQDFSTPIQTVSVNQQQPPTGTDINGSVFQHIANVTISSPILRITLSNLANGPVMADAVRIVPNASSLRFYGNGVNDIDRVKIPIDDPAKPVDVGDTDFTLEWWMKANLSENMNGMVFTGNDGWITGNILFDRDVYGVGDFGDFGVSMGRQGSKGVLCFGVNNGSVGESIIGAANVADGAWHHVAVMRRRSDGFLTLYVDGTLDAQIDGPNGNISYRDGRPTPFPNDPFLVIGAEKHDAGTEYPSYSGWLDEVRISNNLRYTSNFTRPAAPFTKDSQTVGLYHFDENEGFTIYDVSGFAGGPSHGSRNLGGSPAGPIWTADTPFAGRTSGPDRVPPPVTQGQRGSSKQSFASLGQNRARVPPTAQPISASLLDQPHPLSRTRLGDCSDHGALPEFADPVEPVKLDMTIR